MDGYQLFRFNYLSNLTVFEVSCVGILAILLIMIIPSRVYAENLLINPGFESVSTNIADDWWLNSWKGASATFSIQSSIAVNGTAQAITLDSKGDNGGVNLYQNVTIQPGRMYRVEGWVGSGAGTNCTASIAVRADKGDSPYFYHAAGSAKVTVDGSWEKVSFLAVPRFDPRETDHRIILTSIEEGKTCYFDDLSLTDVTEDELSILETSLQYRQPIPASFFGIHINKLGEHNIWPSIGHNTVRLWDTGTTWDTIEPNRGEPFNWRRFDYYMNYIENNDPTTKIIYTMGKTPGWANGGRFNSYPPTDLDDWENYVREVVTKYKGRIDMYEIWNEVDYRGDEFVKGSYKGTIEEMVELGKRAYSVIKSIDPSAIVLTPSVTKFSYLAQYLALGGGEVADAISYHHYYGDSGNLDDVFNEMFLSLAKHDVLKRAGYGHYPVYITELAPKTKCDYTDMQARASVAQGMILAYLFGNDSYDYYFWENSIATLCILPMTLADNQTLTPGGSAYKVMVDWLKGKRIRSFHNLLDTSPSLPTTVVLDRGPNYKAILAWARNGAVNTYTPPDGENIAAVSYLDGRTTSYSGDALSIGPEPVLIEYDTGSQESLTGFWRGEGSGADSSGNQFDATETGVSYVTGRDGEAMSTTAGGYLSVTSDDLLNATDAITISLWYRQAEIKSYDQYLVGKASDAAKTGYLLYIDKETNLPKFRLYNGSEWGWVNASVTLPTAPVLNAWNHLAATFDGSMLKLYLNGELGNTIDIGLYTISPSTADLKLGSSFDGEVDEVRVYNTALSSDEVSALGSNIGHWTFDTVAVNNSINGEDALPDGILNGNNTVSSETVGERGGSLSLNGMNGSNIKVTNHTGMSTDTFSVSLWFKNETVFHNGANEYITLAGQSNWSDKTGFVLMGQSNGMLTFRTYDGSKHGWMNREINIPFNQAGVWTHLVAVSDSNEMSLYINGTLSKRISTNGPMAVNSTNNLVLGNNYKGLLDEVRYYQKPLSDRQVGWLYFNEKP